MAEYFRVLLEDVHVCWSFNFTFLYETIFEICITNTLINIEANTCEDDERTNGASNTDRVNRSYYKTTK